MDELIGRCMSLIRIFPLVICITLIFCNMALGNDEINYVQWQEPNENAFTVEVPQGWDVTGGVIREASGSRAGLHVTSPDGRIIITAGNEEIPQFITPSQVLSLNEGQLVNLYGNTKLVLRYLTGTQLAEWYIANVGASGCTDLSILSEQDRSNAGDPESSGDVSFSCLKNGEAMKGYCFAKDIPPLNCQMGQGCVWICSDLAFYLSPSSQEAVAQSVLKHMLLSIRPNPAWVSANQKYTMQYSDATAKSNAKIADYIDQQYASRSQTIDNVGREYSNSNTGQTDVMNQNTGEAYKVNVDPNAHYYWDCNGKIYTSQTYDSQYSDCTLLSEY